MSARRAVGGEVSMQRIDPTLACDPRVRASIQEWSRLCVERGSTPAEVAETTAGLVKLEQRAALALLETAVARLAESGA
jgi:hypothetical protein